MKKIVTDGPRDDNISWAFFFLFLIILGQSVVVYRPKQCQTHRLGLFSSPPTFLSHLVLLLNMTGT